jgi:hypothetical protein
MLLKNYERPKCAAGSKNVRTAALQQRSEWAIQLARRMPLPVVKFPPDAPFEEATAAVARKDAVVFPRACVSTYDARQT